jgi:hypothetical protein
MRNTTGANAALHIPVVEHDMRFLLGLSVDRFIRGSSNDTQSGLNISLLGPSCKALAHKRGFELAPAASVVPPIATKMVRRKERRRGP